MLFWFVVFTSFLIQEPTAMGALLLAGQHEGKSFVIFFLLWFLATTLDVIIFFWLAKVVRRHFPESKPVRWAEKFTRRIFGYAGRFGKFWIMLVLGFFNFPWMNGFIAPWLDISFGSAFALIVIGDFFWYLIEWLAIAGIVRVIPNFWVSLVIVVVIGLGGTLVLRHFRNKTGIMR